MKSLYRCASVAALAAVTFALAPAVHAQTLSLSLLDSSLNPTNTFNVNVNQAFSIFAAADYTAGKGSPTTANLTDSLNINWAPGLTGSNVNDTVSNGTFPGTSGTDMLTSGSTTSGDLLDFAGFSTPGKYTGTEQFSVYDNTGTLLATSSVENFTINVSGTPPPAPEASTILGLLGLGGTAMLSGLRRRKRSA